jgi:hypothetical protein
MYTSFILQLYSALLRLYPRQFRVEFADEMRSVFAEALSQPATENVFSLAKVLIIELVGLPGEAMRQHFNNFQLRRGQASLGAAAWEGPPSRKEIWVALAVFVLPVLNIWFNSATDISIGILAAIASILFLIGVLRGFPRWSLPSLGLVISAATFLFVYQWVADLFTPSLISSFGPVPGSENTRILLQAFWAGLMWLSLFALTFLVLGLLAIFRRFRPLFWRIRQDWTLASYILYSGVIFILVLTFDQYRYERPYAIASTLCLATGAWLYLHSPKPWQRSLSLLAGFTLAMWAAAFSQWSITSIEDWKSWLYWGALESNHFVEIRWTILQWAWMLVFLLAPIWLRILPMPGRRPRAGP